MNRLALLCFVSSLFCGASFAQAPPPAPAVASPPAEAAPLPNEVAQPETSVSPLIAGLAAASGAAIGTVVGVGSGLVAFLLALKLGVPALGSFSLPLVGVGPGIGAAAGILYFTGFSWRTFATSGAAYLGGVGGSMLGAFGGALLGAGVGLLLAPSSIGLGALFDAGASVFGGLLAGGAIGAGLGTLAGASAGAGFTGALLVE